jgi:hypothetical protein
MTEKAWKATERKIASCLGGQRIPVNGRGDQPDIAHPALSIECKHRRTIPVSHTGALEQARKSATKDELPIAVLHKHGAR